MAAPTVVGTWAASSETTGSTITVQTPSGASSSSTLFVWFTAADWQSLSGMTAPSGWVLVGQYNPGSGPPKAKWFMRLQQGEPPSSFNFGKTNGPPASVMSMAIDGVDQDDPIDDGVDWDDDASAGVDTLAAPSLTTTQAETLMVCGWAATPYQAGSEDDQWSGTVSSTDGVARTVTTDFQAQQIAWDEIASAGATGARTGTFDDTSGDSVGKVSSSFAVRGVQGTGGDQTLSSSQVTEYEAALPSTLAVEGQEPVAEVRTQPITLAERREMLEASTVSYALSRVEVLNEADEVEVQDISDRVTGCRIEHGSARNIHRTIDISIQRDLQWGRQRIKPYLTVDGGGWVDEVPLGVFCLTAPTLVGGVRPATYAVQGYDKTYLLDQALAVPVSYPTDQPVLAAVRELLSLRGIQSDHIANNRGGDVMHQAKSWGVEHGFTYLQVINDLLSMVGYRPLRVDRDGFPESGPHPPASQRNVMWRYNAGAPTTNVHWAGREHVDDFTDRPNRWVFWMNHIDSETPPTQGDGLYIVDNITEGPSSQNARGGLVITRAEGVEALTQADLVAVGDRIVDEDKLSSSVVRMVTDLNPYHDHQDVMEIIDGDLGVAGKFESMTWQMDVFERMMNHETRSLEGGIAT